MQTFLFLETVLIEHAKKIISDLIGLTMKNLLSMMRVSTLNKNLFHVGSQKTTEILEEMMKCLLQVLPVKGNPDFKA